MAARSPSSLERATLLRLGARGAHGGAPFVLVGRACVVGPRGVTWNEWSLRFDDGKTSFLVESIDALTLYDEGSLLPDFAAIAPGAPLATDFVVVQRGVARRVAHWGETEVDDAPRSYAFVELSSRDGRIATIDFGSEATGARVFTGRRVSLAELGLSGDPLPTGASLEGLLVEAPAVSRPKGVEQWLEVGDEADLLGSPCRVLGMLSRSTATEGDERARWDEYLLGDRRDPRSGPHRLRWLVVADGHFNLVHEVEPGKVERSGSGADYEGVHHELVSEGTARVDWAAGRLPFEVTLGETSELRELVHAPFVLSEERTADAVTWSRGVYVPSDVIAKAFGKRALPRPVGRAPNAPR